MGEVSYEKCKNNTNTNDPDILYQAVPGRQLQMIHAQQHAQPYSLLSKTYRNMQS